MFTYTKNLYLVFLQLYLIKLWEITIPQLQKRVHKIQQNTAETSEDANHSCWLKVNHEKFNNGRSIQKPII